MNKKMMIIGASIITIIAVVILIVTAMPKNKPSNNTNIENGNTAQVYQCSDGVDNDNDELIDEKDPGCHSDNNVDNSSSYDPKDDNEGNELMQGGTLRSLFSGEMGNDLMCETVYKVADNEMMVTMYISLKYGMRLDYELKNPEPGMMGEAQTDLHMISDKEYGYVWGNSTLGGMMQGFKIKMDDMNNTDLEQEAPAGTEMIDFEMPVTNCKPWIVDEKMFEIPEGIEFIDPENLEDMTIEDLILDESVEINCSLCHQLPAGEVAGCLSSLGCN